MLQNVWEVSPYFQLVVVYMDKCQCPVLYQYISTFHISAVGITLLDNSTSQCTKVVFTAQQCSATINGVNTSSDSSVFGQYQFQLKSTDKSLMISGQKGAKRFSPVIKVSCIPSRAAVNQNHLLSSCVRNIITVSWHSG